MTTPPQLIDVSDINLYTLIAGLYGRADEAARDPAGIGSAERHGADFFDDFPLDQRERMKRRFNAFVTEKRIRHDISNAHLRNTTAQQIVDYFDAHGLGFPQFKEGRNGFLHLTPELSRQIGPMLAHFTLHNNGCTLDRFALTPHESFGRIMLDNYRGVGLHAAIRIDGEKKWLNPISFEEVTPKGALERMLAALREGKPPFQHPNIAEAFKTQQRLERLDAMQAQLVTSR